MTGRNFGNGTGSAKFITPSPTRGVIRKYTQDHWRSDSLSPEMKRQKCDAENGLFCYMKMFTFGDSSSEYRAREGDLNEKLQTLKRAHVSPIQYGNPKIAKVNEDNDGQVRSSPKKPQQSPSFLFGIQGTDRHPLCTECMEKYVDDTDRYNTRIKMAVNDLLSNDDIGSHGSDIEKYINEDQKEVQYKLDNMAIKRNTDYIRSDERKGAKSKLGNIESNSFDIGSYSSDIERNTDDSRGVDREEAKCNQDDMVFVEDVIEKSSPFYWPPTIEDTRGYDIDVFLVEDDDDDDDDDDNRKNVDKRSMDVFDEMVFVENSVERSAGYIQTIEAN